MTLQTRFPTLFNQPHSGEWLTEQDYFLAPNTVSAYGYALVDYFRFCAIRGINPPEAKRVDIVAYIRDFSTRSKSTTLGRRHGYVRSTTHEGFANATVRLRVATVRLYYQYLMEEGVRLTNPVKAGKHTKGNWPGAKRRGMVPRHGKDPWLPDEKQWQALLLAASSEPIRNRFMLALAYDAGLRRGELCALESGDIQPSGPSGPLLKLREETTKNQLAREVPYSPVTGELYKAYLEHRESLGQPLGPLFLSESRRNKGQPITFWTWTKTVEALGKRAGLPLLTTHTLRHLRLTDLAQANWKLPQIAAFAGHSSIATTMIYVHLSGRELRERFRQTFDSMLDWRQETLKTSLL